MMGPHRGPKGSQKGHREKRTSRCFSGFFLKCFFDLVGRVRCAHSRAFVVGSEAAPSGIRGVEGSSGGSVRVNVQIERHFRDMPLSPGEFLGVNNISGRFSAAVHVILA